MKGAEGQMAPLAANGADWGVQGGEKGKWGMAVQVWGPGLREWSERWRADVGEGLVVGAASR